MRLNVGTSTLADPAAAVSAAARSALGASTSPVLALLFSTFEYGPAAVSAAAQRELAEVPWAGVVTPAILAGPHIMARGVAVGVIDCERMRVRVGASGPRGTDVRDAGRRAARNALVDMPLPPADRSRAMLLFTDTDNCDAAETVHGALSVAGAGIAWSGGGTGACDV
ncbi:MAG: hypothetical protein JWP97_4474, partial [Labilithrix sp.]|nr:hypothetical protein [Labilithrix sp.]